MKHDERERKKAEIIQLFKEADEDTRRQTHAEPPFSPRISGDGNVVAGRDVNINKRETVRTVVEPGPEHITSKQAATLQELVRKAANHDVAGGMSPSAAMAKWWTALKRTYGVPTYREIPQELGDDAIAWMKQQIARSRSKLRRTDKQSWRNEHYAAIYARAGELGIPKGELYAIVHDRLGKRVGSLKQLGDQNLKKLYNIIMAMER